jgi:HYDIN/CFA65/VesB-like, Ig-like domain
MTNHGPITESQEKLNMVGGRVVRLLMVLATLPGILLTANRTAAQGLVVFSPTSASFGSVNEGSSKTLSITIWNDGRTALTITKESVSGSAFSVSGLTVPKTIQPATSITVAVKFAPEASGAFSGYMALTSNASNSPVNLAMTGTGLAPALQATPSSASFGSVPLGTTNSQTVQLTNVGGVTVTISSVSVAGKGFALHGLTTPLVLACGKTANATVTFDPTVSGYVAGTVSVASNATNNTLTMTVSGTGVADTRTIAAAPTSLSFGNENLGHTNTLPVTLRNTGNSSVTLSGATISGAGITTSALSGTLIAPGQTTTFNVTFAPKTAGAVAGSVEVTSNATNSPATISVGGDGIAPTTHSVELSWAASTSAGIVGYIVYRATEAGSYDKLDSALVTGLKFTDATVAAGTTYKYVVTAVDTLGLESTYSEPITAAVP